MAVSNVYIPLCGSKPCDDRLESVARAVGYCTTKHEMYGRYDKWFQQHFDSNHFTVLHRCPFLWQKIHMFKEKCMEHDYKLILVTLDIQDVTEKTSKCNQVHIEEVNMFFDEFGSAHLVSCCEELDKFADKLKSCVRKYLGEEEEEREEKSASHDDKHGCDNPSNHASADSADLLDGADNEQPVSDSPVFNKYPDIFGEMEHQHVFALKSPTFKLTDDLKKRSTSVGEQINEVNKNLPEDRLVSNIKLILLKLLPHIFRKGDLTALASASNCKYPVVQKRALILLELALWEGLTSDQESELKYLVNTEGQLDILLKTLRDNYLTSKSVVQLALLERASNVYIMVLSAIIMSSKHSQVQAQKCMSYLDTIQNRTSTLHSKATKLSVCLKKLEQFLKESIYLDKVTSSCEKFLNTLTESTTKPIHLSAKGLLNKTLCVQVVVIFEVLKKVYHSVENNKALDFLNGYLNKDSRLTVVRKVEPDRTCIVMVFRALTLFLKYRIHKFSHLNLQVLCKAILKVLSIASLRDLPDEIGRTLHSLLFHPNALVREGIFSIVDSRKKLVLTPQQYIQEEVIRILDPLLTQTKLFSMNGFIPMSIGWCTMCCMLGGRRVVAHVHVEDHRHRKGIKAALENHEDINYNEMYHLIRLQHENILQLLAYQRTQVPLFYIVEDCSQNLQNVMQNYRESGKFFSHLELCRFMLQVISGLQYCHNLNLIHRNLTAQSMAFTSEKKIKLSSFGLCAPLGPEQKIIDIAVQKQIPFRWSAPESIFEHEYTKQSDMWMVGILTYEVMTHGCLPFSNLKLLDRELGDRLRNRTIHLLGERCLDKDTERLISDCASYDQESRLFIENVKTQLEEILDKAKKFPRTIDQYPFKSFENDESMPSILFNRGLPFNLRGKSTDIEVNIKNVEQLKVSDILVAFKKGSTMIFFEEVLHKMSPSTMSLFQQPELRSFMAHLHRQKIYQTRDSSQYLMSSIPASESVLSLVLHGKVSSLLSLWLLIHQVALTLSQIATLDLVMGDLYPAAVFVEKSNSKKLHIMSLAFMHRTAVADEYNSYCPTNTGLPDFMLPRAAPELFQQVEFSKETDVYCFGNFMWELLTAYSLHGSGAYYSNISRAPFSNLSPQELKDAVMQNEWEIHNPRPDCCPEEMYLLMKSCVHCQKGKRPTIHQVLSHLEDYCKQLDEHNGVEFDLLSLGNWELLIPENPSPAPTECNDYSFSGSEWSSMLSLLSDQSLQEVNPSIQSLSVSSSIDKEEEYLSPDYTFRDKVFEQTAVKTPLPPPPLPQLPDPNCSYEVYMEYEPNENLYCSLNDISVESAVEESPPIPESPCPPMVPSLLSPRSPRRKPVPPPKPNFMSKLFKKDKEPN